MEIKFALVCDDAESRSKSWEAQIRKFGTLQESIYIEAMLLQFPPQCNVTTVHEENIKLRILRIRI